ncbi:unnamed protein product [Urochloa humidicola]
MEEDKTQQPLDGATAAGLEEVKPQQPLDGATAADAATITPWKLRPFNTGANKPKAPPGPIRIITAPRMAAPAQEMWTRAAATREQVNYAVELENLSSSVATIGSGVGKLCTGFGLKILSQEEKEAAAATEKKAIEEKNAAQELLAAEEKLAAAKLNDTEMEERKKKKEEERRREEEQAKKERIIALLLSVPGHLVNVSSVLNGLREIACGTKGVLVSMSLMVRSAPSLARRVRTTTADWCCNMGTGSLGFRMALDRQVVTRASDGRVSVLDASGSRRERVPAALGGALIITNEEELYQAIDDFRSGRLNQLIDVDEKVVTLMMALNMWRVLCTERLCGLLCPDSLLPEMALRASALINEEIAVKGHLKDAKNAVKDAEKAVKEHQFTVDVLQARLNGVVVVPKVEKP